jgi:DNA polymerase I-like protein with 3'-5' exonuclease and polymerase domains
MLTVNDKNFDWANIPLGDCLHGNAMDTHFTLRLFHALEELLQEEGCWHVMEKLLSPVLPVFSDMEYEGLHVAPEELGSVGKSLDKQAMSKEDELLMYKQVKRGANLASTVDLREILYTDEGGFLLYPPKRTGKGEPSTDKATLDELLDFITDELNDRAKKTRRQRKADRS